MPHTINTNNIRKFYFGQTTAHSIEVLSLKIEVSQLLDLFILLISIWHLQVSLGKKIEHITNHKGGQSIQVVVYIYYSVQFIISDVSWCTSH